jgi:hypothetical protein
MTLQGRVENGVVVFQNRAGAALLPDGTLVEVTPLRHGAGSAAAILAALEAAPKVSPEDVAELERAIAAGNRPATTDPFADHTPGQVSKERKEALLALIGCCKTDHPPSDEEVERIIEEERMKKYG